MTSEIRPSMDSDVKEVNVIPAEVVELLAELDLAFQDNDIGLIARQNSNGADYYECPCCGSEEKVKGHASGMASLSRVEHKDWCPLNRLKTKFDWLKKTHGVLFAD